MKKTLYHPKPVKTAKIKTSDTTRSPLVNKKIRHSGDNFFSSVSTNLDSYENFQKEIKESQEKEAFVSEIKEILTLGDRLTIGGSGKDHQLESIEFTN